MNVTKLIRDMVLRPNGATMAELVRATGWQPHSIRGFVSGVLRKQFKFNIPTYRGRYRISGPPPWNRDIKRPRKRREGYASARQ